MAFRHDGREAEEAVADVMDFLVGWSSSHMRVQTFPQLGSSLRYAVHPRADALLTRGHSAQASTCTSTSADLPPSIPDWIMSCRPVRRYWSPG